MTTKPRSRRLRALPLSAVAASVLLAACGGRQSPDLAIDRVVLYQSGIAYIERTGQVDGDVLTMTVRPDQINDLLASLAVRDENGSTVTVSFPVDAAGDPRMPGIPDHAVGSGGISALLEAFRGATVRASTLTEHVRGRIVSVDRSTGTHRLTLYTSSSELVALDVDALERIEIVNDGLALALERALDRRLADGDWKAVDISVRFSDSRRRNVAVSYVLEAPTWKPAYRAIVDDSGLRLQGWAVVDNVSGDDWSEVRLSLTSGTPISFRYDLHSPIFVDRPDLSGYHTPSVADLRPPTPMRSTPAAAARTHSANVRQEQQAYGRSGGSLAAGLAPAPAPAMESAADFEDEDWGLGDVPAEPVGSYGGGAAEVTELGALYRYDIPGRVTLADQTSTLVSLIDDVFDGEESLLFQPETGGSSSVHPYRALRFTNESATPLEPAPITIYRAGTFVGEGLLPSVTPGERTFVPYSLERRVQVDQRRSPHSGEATLLRIVNGRVLVERENHVITRIELVSSLDEADTVWIRVPRTPEAELVDPPANHEVHTHHWLVPVPVAPNTRSSVELTTRTRRQEAIGVDDSRMKPILAAFLSRPDLRPDLAEALRPVLERFERIDAIQARISELHRLRSEVQNRTNELRRNLQSLGTSDEGARLRETLRERLEEQEALSARIATELVELAEEQSTLRVSIAEDLRAIQFDD